MFWYIVFSFVLRYFLISLVISLIHWLFKSVLFPHICVCSDFPSIDCLFHSNAIGKDICMFSILKKLLKLPLWSNVWLILENVPCTLEKNIYSDVGRNVPYTSVRPNSFISVQFSSVSQSCPTLCDPMSPSTPGLPVHHQLLEFTQTHVHRVSDAIQPSHPLSSPSPLAPNPSQHQSLFQ